MTDTPTRVLIVDGRPQVRSALHLALEQCAGAVVVGEASAVEEALRLAAALRPDLVLLDWELAGKNGASALIELRRARPGLAVVALSSRPEAQRVALSAGADRFVSKGGPPERLMAAVRGCTGHEVA
jgi:DNA-binding NarL/FixJ family response regulator